MTLVQEFAAQEVVALYQKHHRAAAAAKVWRGSDEQKLERIEADELRKVQACLSNPAILMDLVQVGRITDPDNPAFRTGGASYGLFARQDLPTGTCLPEYAGEVQLLSAFEKEPERTLSSDCVFDLKTAESWFPKKGAMTCEGLVIHCDRKKGIMAYPNDFRDGRGKVRRNFNIEFNEVVIEGWPHLIPVTTREVKKNEEILVHYGDSYWPTYHHNQAVLGWINSSFVKRSEIEQAYVPIEKYRELEQELERRKGAN